jgi:hypothetical protein
MTAYMRWAIATRLIAFVGVLIAIGSQWVEPVVSSRYSTIALLVGFVLAFVGVSAARGIFMFRGVYKRLEQEELDRLKQVRNL